MIKAIKIHRLDNIIRGDTIERFKKALEFKHPMQNCFGYEDEDQEEEMTDEELKEYNDKMNKLFEKLINR